MKTNYFLLVLIALIALTSCGNNKDIIEPEKPEPEKPVIPTPIVDDITNKIKDVELKKYIQAAVKSDWAKYDTEAPFGILSLSEVAQITHLDLNAYDKEEKVASLEGLEYFTGLEYLDCSWNKISTLDLSKNTNLKSLNCAYNVLSTLNISKNIALQTLECNDNHMASLDISNLKELQRLTVNKNKLTRLELENNAKLIQLDCSNNNLTELYLEANNQLYNLKCNSNQLTMLDISKNKNIRILECIDNPLIALYVWKNFSDANHNGFLMPIETKILEKLHPTYVDDITTVIQDNNLRDYIKSAIRGEWAIYDTEMPKGILSSDEAAKIESINISGKNIRSIDLEHFIGLKRLDCSNNILEKINLSNNHLLEELNFSKNKIAEFNVSQHLNLTKLECEHNLLTKLELLNLAKLKYLNCSDNNLSPTLTVDNCPNLEVLGAGLTDIKELNIANCDNMKELYIGVNNLTKLDLKLPNLEILFCHENFLTELNTSGLPKLRELDCEGLNTITYCDLQGSPLLEKIEARGLASRATLDISKNKNLKKVSLPINNNLIVYVWKGFDWKNIEYFDGDYTKFTTIEK